MSVISACKSVAADFLLLKAVSHVLMVPDISTGALEIIATGVIFTFDPDRLTDTYTGRLSAHIQPMLNKTHLNRRA